MTKKNISYGIVGCGYSFRAHAEAIAKNKESRLIAVFDVDASRSREAAQRYGCERKPDLKALFSDPAIDAAIICSPHDTHERLVLDAITAGKFALCEKPLALSARECGEIVRSEHYRKNVIMVFQVRFNPAIQFLLALVRSGALGRIRFCAVCVRKYRDRTYFSDGWHGNLEKHGGMLFNQGAHALDLMLEVCGEPAKIKGLQQNIRPFKAVEDIYLANVEFKNGALGNIEVTTYATHRNVENSIYVIGDGGSVKVGGEHFDAVEHFSVKGARAGDLPRGGRGKTSHALLLEAASGYLLGREASPLLPFADDGARLTEFIEKLYDARNVSLAAAN